MRGFCFFLLSIGYGLFIGCLYPPVESVIPGWGLPNLEGTPYALGGGILIALLYIVGEIEIRKRNRQ